MDSDAVEKIVMAAIKRETASLRDEINHMKTEQKKNEETIENLKNENKKLWEEIQRVDRNIDEVEQYNRKSSLILGGAFPEGVEGETPQETRETVRKVLKEKLKVEIKGEIVACHRLRNKRRVIVKFQDSDDREAVYQSKFEQEGQPGEKITIHENLTEKRAKMVMLLEEMRKKREVLNYHTKNGNIMARDSASKRYSRIQPWFSMEEIKSTLQNASARQFNNHNNFLRSQTLSNIPQGAVARKATSLEEFVVTSGRQTRQTRKSEKSEQ